MVLLGSGKMIVNFKEVEGRTISFDPKKGLMVNNVVVDPTVSGVNKSQDDINENDFEPIPLITDNEEAVKEKEVKKGNIKKKVLILLGLTCMISASVVILKGLKDNDD